ncbi:hypothetical protein PENTCL1PPCAC_9631 [Pristionchus entomophagus]|uniref:Uncharacterized protein n=1 Tax=Pristionchus entomophagus TaxID=358040 RepID=A0AAV5T6Y7_9BILA|nr:hypothetical protein PENTCL1PPCAC_9631 [Pristionchus entomophagus]
MVSLPFIRSFKLRNRLWCIVFRTYPPAMTLFILVLLFSACIEAAEEQDQQDESGFGFVVLVIGLVGLAIGASRVAYFCYIQMREEGGGTMV